MSLIGRVRRVDLKFLFGIEIPGVGSADFADCTEPTVTAGDVTLWEGGRVIPKKEPGRLTFSDITLTRGMTRDMSLWFWMKDTADAASNKGAPSPTHKRHVSIVQRDRVGIQVERIEFFFAYCKEYGAGDFNNDADEFRMERVVIAYNWFDRVPLTVF